MAHQPDETQKHVLAASQHRAESQRDEVDQLLGMAEEYSERCERISARLSLLVTGAVALGVSLVAFAVLYPGVLWETSVETALLTVNLVAASGLLARSIMALQGRLATERAALRQIVELLREIEPVLAESESWSALERASFRIRLSRFGVFPGSQAGRWPREERTGDYLL